MLTTVRWSAVLLGAGAGGLVTVIAALLLFLVFEVAGIDQARLAGLAFGLVTGLAAGGYVGGRVAHHSHRFHGMLVGMALAGLVVVIARLGGSPAPTGQVLTLVAIALVCAGTGGVVGGRRRR